jgi:general secretion pathway protein I
MNGRKTASGQRGFTLLEVLIAVVIVGTAFVALLGLHARGVKLVIRDQNLTRATLLARQKISQVEFTVATQGLEGLGNSEGNDETYPDFHWQIEVNPTELEEVRMVIVRVTWDEAAPGAEVVYFVREQAAPL